MAWVPGKLNKVTYTFSTGSVAVYGANFEDASVALVHTYQLSSKPKNVQVTGHNTTDTKHKTFGALLSITYP